MIGIRVLALSFLLMIPSGKVFSKDIKEKKRRSSQITLSIDNGIVFNSANVSNNGSYPDAISVPKKMSYRPGIMLEFQRTTSYGLLFGGGFSLGNYRQDFDVVYDSYDFLDTSQVYRDKSARFFYRNQSLYWGVRFYIGYSLPVKLSKLGTFTLEGKWATTYKNYLKGGAFQQVWAVSEVKNDTIYVNKYMLSDIGANWGKSTVTSMIFFDFNIALKKDLHWKPVCSVTLGLYASMRASKPGLSTSDKSDVSVRSPHYKNGQYEYGDMDYYLDRDITIGIRTSFGLKL